MPLVYCDKPPLPVPAALGLSDRTKDYDDLPPTPPGLPEHSWVKTIREVRELLPRLLLALFAQPVDTVDAEDLSYVVDDWAIFAGRSHAPEDQATEAHSQGRRRAGAAASGRADLRRRP